MTELTISPVEKHSRIHLPSSLQLLLAPGIRGHTLLFTVVLGFLFGASYVGRALGFASTWTIVFVIGASASATYLVLAPLALSENFRNKILFTNMKRRVIILAAVFGPVVAGISYWIYQAGSVEALPVFPYFIGIFYAWILSQAFFIANPVTHAMLKLESGVVGKGIVKRMMRTLGMTVLFLPIAPLTFGVWEISSWANQNYASVRGASTDVLVWTMAVTLALVATYFLTVMWGWRNIKNGRPQAAIFAGGTFVVVWGYLLYRATTLLMGFISQNEPSNAILDSGLMVVSIFGAMQTFARKAVNRADRRWGQVLPFLVFSFGSVYAVAQFYFILQGSLTRAGLSAIVNGIVFAVGTLTLMLLLRSHLKIPTSEVTVGTPVPAGDEAILPPSNTEELNALEAAEASGDSQPLKHPETLLTTKPRPGSRTWNNQTSTPIRVLSLETSSFSSLEDSSTTPHLFQNVMSTVQLAQIKTDEKTSASQSELRIGQHRIPLPNRFPISPERNALKPAGVKDPLPGEIAVLARLAPPETVKKILTQEDAVKSMARFLSKETAPDAIRMLYLAFKGGAAPVKTEDLKTLLDLQFLAGLDIITVQHSLDHSLDDYESHLHFAERWMEERGVEKPLMPVIQATENKETSAKLLALVEKHDPSMIGFDLRGGFYYHALRGIEDFKKKHEKVWIHALQTPPKVRFGRGLLTCSEGMILPMFGIDSFSRWIVPPPPTPLTKEVINVFDRKGWGSMKKKDYEAIRNNNTNCDCAVCQGKDLEPFYEGKVLDVLAKAKVHDHLAQRKELESARESIKKGRFLTLLNTKEYPREFLKQLPRTDDEKTPSRD